MTLQQIARDAAEQAKNKWWDKCGGNQFDDVADAVAKAVLEAVLKEAGQTREDVLTAAEHGDSKTAWRICDAIKLFLTQET